MVNEAQKHGVAVGAWLKHREARGRSATTHRKPGEVVDLTHKRVTSPVRRARTVAISTAVGRSLRSPGRRANAFTIGQSSFRLIAFAAKGTSASRQPSGTRPLAE